MDHRLNLSGAVLREVDCVTLANDPATGALSAFNAAEAIAFSLLRDGSDLDAVAGFFRQLGRPEDDARSAATAFVERLAREGWARGSYPENCDGAPLKAIYFTVTRDCNLACPYCYQGLSERRGKHMSLDAAEWILDAVREVNAECHVVVTGGEPLRHPRLFDILDAIEVRGMSMSLLTNGVLIDDEIAGRLGAYGGLDRVQVSIDGLGEETHSQTRGKGNFARTIAGIQILARHRLPLVLAPTIHEGNAHEIVDIARLGLDLGGYFNPNDLRELPQSVKGAVSLRPETLRRVLRELGAMMREYDPDLLRERQRLGPPQACGAALVNARFICGMAHSVVDIDWNGDVYPCHLLKGEELRLGNALENSFPDLFAVAKAKGFRVKSYEISKCRDCAVMSICGGGCRAGAYYQYGSTARESDMCEQFYWGNVNQLLRGKGAAR